MGICHPSTRSMPVHICRLILSVTSPTAVRTKLRRYRHPLSLQSTHRMKAANHYLVNDSQSHFQSEVLFFKAMTLRLSPSSKPHTPTSSLFLTYCPITRLQQPWSSTKVFLLTSSSALDFTHILGLRLPPTRAKEWWCVGELIFCFCFFPLPSLGCRYLR